MRRKTEINQPCFSLRRQDSFLPLEKKKFSWNSPFVILYLGLNSGLNLEQNMKHLNISSDIVPIGEFKSSLSKWLKNIQNTGHPLVITQNGRPAGVLLSPSNYDELVYKGRFLESVNRGLSDAESDNVYTTKELKKELEKRRQRGTR